MSILLAAAVACSTVRVHDGDGLFCNGEKIRIANIDAPELPGSPKCEDRRAATAWCDYALAQQSKRALPAFVRQGRVTIQRTGVDRFGRTLAVVAVNGADAGEYLISVGLARRWR